MAQANDLFFDQDGAHSPIMRPRVQVYKKSPHNTFIMKPGTYFLAEHLRNLYRNMGYVRARKVVRWAHQKIRSPARAELRRMLPKKKRARRRQKKTRNARGSVLREYKGISNYPPSHYNWWKYRRKGGELKKSIYYLTAKASPPYMPYLQFWLRDGGYPWVFLRGGTADRRTGRKGGKVVETGMIPKRIFLSNWAERTTSRFEVQLYNGLRKYSVFGDRMFEKKPRPPG